MRNSNFLLAIVLLIPLLILGCDENNNSIGSDPLTEDHFASNPALRDNPEKGIVINFLESPSSEELESDTGEIGIDEIPVRYSRTLEHTLCWEDDDAQAMHFMVLTDTEGTQILTLDVNGDCVTQVIERGNYLMTIHHDGRTETTFPIFIVPEVEVIEEAKVGTQSESMIAKAKEAVYRVLADLNIGFTQSTHAQTAEDIISNIVTLFNTNRCLNCNLVGLELPFMGLTRDLSFSNLKGSDLTGARMDGAKLDEANLSGTNCTGAVLTNAELSNSNFKGANLTGANLTGAQLLGTFFESVNFTAANLKDLNLSFLILSKSNFTAADLTNTNLSRADLTDAILTPATLSGATLDGATWCDGCQCDRGSVGQCGGCASQDTCTGL